MAHSVRGHVAIVLHTHLPYVHHPEYEDFLEEDWLFEAMTETYLPLVYVMRDLTRDGVRYRRGMRPPTRVAPLRSSAAASPRGHSCRSSIQSSSSAVDRS